MVGNNGIHTRIVNRRKALKKAALSTSAEEVAVVEEPEPEPAPEPVKKKAAKRTRARSCCGSQLRSKVPCALRLLSGTGP